MIEPFTITEIRQEEDGSLGVLYTVSASSIVSESERVTKTLSGYFHAHTGQDVKAALFEYLQKGGWIT